MAKINHLVVFFTSQSKDRYVEQLKNLEYKEVKAYCYYFEKNEIIEQEDLLELPAKNKNILFILSDIRAIPPAFYALLNNADDTYKIKIFHHVGDHTKSRKRKQEIEIKIPNIIVDCISRQSIQQKALEDFLVTEGKRKKLYEDIMYSVEKKYFLDLHLSILHKLNKFSNEQLMDKSIYNDCLEIFHLHTAVSSSYREVKKHLKDHKSTTDYHAWLVKLRNLLLPKL